MHGRKGNYAFRGRQRLPSSSHHRKRSRSPPRLSHSRSPYRPLRRGNSPLHSLERRSPPLRYIEKSRSQSYLERSNSPAHRLGRNKSPPHTLGRNKSPPHSLGRSRSPVYYPGPGRSKSPVHYRQRTRSPSSHYLEGNESSSAQYLEKSQPTSHYLERSEYPPHYVERNKSPLWRSQSPSYNLERNKSPSSYFEKNQSPPHYLKRSQSPSYNLERDESPVPTHYLEKNEIPPDYLRRTQSPASDLGRNKSPPQYFKKSRSPFTEKNQSPTNYFRRDQSPDHSFETRNSPLYFSEKAESPTYNIEGNASPTPYSRRSMSPSNNFRRSESSVEHAESNDYPYQYSRGSKSPTQYFRGESHSPYPDGGFDGPSAYLDHDSDHNESPPHFMDTDDPEQCQSDHQPYDDAPFTSQGAPKARIFRASPLKFSMDNPKNPRQSISIKIKSLEEIDEMPNWRMKNIRIPANAHRKVKSLARTGVSFMEAKRTVVKQIFLKKRDKQMVACARGPPLVKKRPESIAVVHEGYPRVHLGIHKLKMIEKAILSAYECLPNNGPEVCFRKCQYKSGFLLVRSLYRHSTDWLKQLVPQLQPWEGAVLRIQSKKNMVPPKPVKCMAFVPDEEGERLSSDVFLDKLRISNPGLNSHLWMAVGKSAENKGVLWTFNMDVESLNFLEKVNMQPFYGLGKLKFTLHSAVV